MQDVRKQDNSTKIVAKTDVIVDGDLSSEKLAKLIKLQREEERLDYKRAYNLSGKKASKDKVECVCDIVSMANTYGGYIVLGVDETTEDKRKYKPVGINEEILAELDIDRLRAQVERYINERIDLQLQIHRLPKYKNLAFACIFVAKSDRSPIIFEKPGTYQDENEPSEQRVIFRSGEIFVRKGASSSRADQNDMRGIISQIRRREKDRWTEEILGVRDLVNRLDRLINVLSEGKTASKEHEQVLYNEKNLYLSGAAFEEHILNLLERDKPLIIRRYLQTALSVFFKEIQELSGHDDSEIQLAQDNNLLPILDNLVILGKVFIFFEQVDLFNELQNVLYLFCKQAHSTQFPQPRDNSLHFNSSWVWREIITRVYVLGGILIYKERYHWTPKLIRQPIEWNNYHRRYFWARYILTILSRERRLEEKSLCRLGEVYIENSPYVSEVFLNNKDASISSICQFDYLQCIHVITETKSFEAPYPSFGIYNNHRTEPIIAKLISGEVRRTIPEISDKMLAQMIKGLDEYAGKAFFMYNGWDANFWSDRTIPQFLAQQLTENS